VGTVLFALWEKHCEPKKSKIMKKILVALAMSGFVYCSAQAQTDVKNCGTTSNQVCKRSSGNNVSCYKTKYAENFKVCKNDNGYYICCETPDGNNATHPVNTAVAVNEYRDDYNAGQQQYANQEKSNRAPESQSFLEYSQYSSYEGYYNTAKGKMKVCYGGNNVAKLTRAPWEGCPSPENDGTDKNIQRNPNAMAPETK